MRAPTARKTGQLQSTLCWDIKSIKDYKIFYTLAYRGLQCHLHDHTRRRITCECSLDSSQSALASVLMVITQKTMITHQLVADHTRRLS